jgi:hypothetical protein
MGMSDSGDYLLINYGLQAMLDSFKYEGINTFSKEKKTLNYYSYSGPSIQFVDRNFKTWAYAIEPSIEISDEIISKWIKISVTCDFFHIVVPDEIKTNVKTICANHLKNWSVISFKFEISDNGRRVIFN